MTERTEEGYTPPDHDYTKLHNKHAGETCLLVATGPSLKDVPLGFLKAHTTFSLNGITVMAPRFVPDYYLCIGLTHFNSEEKRMTMWKVIAHEDCQAAFIQRMWAYAYPYSKVYSTMGAMDLYGFEAGYGGFSSDPFICLGTSTNSVYPSLQFIYYLGFTRVLCVGLDNHYPDGPDKHFYPDDVMPGFDIGPAHNTEENWEKFGNESFKIAKHIFERDGRRIINLTPDSAETVFEKDKLEAWA